MLLERRKIPGFPKYTLTALVLAACGSTGGDTATTPPINYAAHRATLSALQATWATAAFTDPATLPLSGSASFTGVIAITVETATGPLDMAGALSITSNFSTDSLTGNANRFINENNIAMSGNLAITGGFLDRTVNPMISHTYSANINGALSVGGDSFLIGGDLSGDFLGPNALATSGIASGSAISSFGTGYMFGTFLAQQ